MLYYTWSDEMIYACKYSNEGLTRKENAAKQKALTRELLKKAILIHTGAPADFSSMVFGEHGKPRFENCNVHYNLTNTNGLICCAVHDTEVGIDAEVIRPYTERRAERVCTDREKHAIKSAADIDLEFIKYWTLKESYVKYTGDGLGYGAKNAEFCYESNNIKHLGTNTFISQSIQEIGKTLYVISVCSETYFPFEISFL